MTWMVRFTTLAGYMLTRGVDGCWRLPALVTAGVPREATIAQHDFQRCAALKVDASVADAAGPLLVNQPRQSFALENFRVHVMRRS